jgi:NAD(P)-dependent dehydrogenase (short-subunit alcohol dehydrogenase family)
VPAARVIAVTGAARGVGREVALGFARRGERLVLADVDRAGLAGVAREVEAAGGEAVARTTDVAIPSQCDALIEAAVARWNALDVLVNNAGTGLWGPAVDLADADWQRVIAVNLGGVIACSRAALRVMLPRRGGHIITIASDRARTAAANFAAYTASKFAVAGFMQAVALEARPHGVKVSLLHPGIIDTRFREHQVNRPPETIPDPSRMLTAGDVADAVVWIASTSASAVPTEVVLDPARE